MGLAKDFVVRFSKSQEYATFLNAIFSEDKTAADGYTTEISRQVEDFAAEHLTRITGYDFKGAMERGKFTQKEKVRFAVTDTPRRGLLVHQIRQFMGAIKNQAESHMPEWYEEAGVNLRYPSLSQ